jgi:hypothetical protein
MGRSKLVAVLAASCALGKVDPVGHTTDFLFLAMT